MRGNKYVIGKDMLKLVYAGHKLRVGMPAIKRTGAAKMAVAQVRVGKCKKWGVALGGKTL